VGPALEVVAGTQGTPLKPFEELFWSTWLTCMVEPVTNVRVVLDNKYWPNYSYITVMSSVVETETWG